MSRNNTPWGDASDSASMISSEIAYESDDSIYESEADSESDDEDVTLASQWVQGQVAGGPMQDSSKVNNFWSIYIHATY